MKLQLPSIAKLASFHLNEKYAHPILISAF